MGKVIIISGADFSANSIEKINPNGNPSWVCNGFIYDVDSKFYSAETLRTGCFLLKAGETITAKVLPSTSKVVGYNYVTIAKGSSDIANNPPTHSEWSLGDIQQIQVSNVGNPISTDFSYTAETDCTILLTWYEDQSYSIS